MAGVEAVPVKWVRKRHTESQVLEGHLQHLAVVDPAPSLCGSCTQNLKRGLLPSWLNALLLSGTLAALPLAIVLVAFELAPVAVAVPLWLSLTLGGFVLLMLSLAVDYWQIRRLGRLIPDWPQLVKAGGRARAEWETGAPAERVVAQVLRRIHESEHLDAEERLLAMGSPCRGRCGPPPLEAQAEPSSRPAHPAEAGAGSRFDHPAPEYITMSRASTHAAGVGLLLRLRPAGCAQRDSR
jgi:hypothetical protein